MGKMDFTDKGVPYSAKTRNLKNTLSELSINNLQAMRLMNDRFRISEQFGRNNRGRVQAGDAAVGGMYQLGSSRSVKTPRSR